MPRIHTAKAEVVAPSRRRAILTLFCAVSCGGAIPAQAGLAEWLHGSPPPRPKASPPDKVAVVSRTTGAAADAQVEDFLHALAVAIKSRDGKPMLPRLADRYTIDDLPSGLKASDYFAQAVEQTPGADEIVIRSIAVQSGVRIAQTEFRYPKDLVKSVTFRFDADGRLLASDLFKLKRQGDGG
jgi:hypothetical protein